MDNNQVLEDKLKTSMDMVLTLVEHQSSYFRDMQEFQDEIFRARLHTTEVTLFSILSCMYMLLLLGFSNVNIPNVLFTIMVIFGICTFIFTIFISNRRRKKLNKLYDKLKQLESDISSLRK